MEQLFLTVLNMSITASWVILAVLAARVLLRRAPKVYSYVLWSVVAFRLGCPVSFRSAFSVLNALNFGGAQTVRPVAGSAMQSGAMSSAGMAYVPPEIGFAAKPEVHVGSEAVSGMINGSLPAATPMYSANPIQIWLAVATVIWCVGMAVMLGCSAISWLRLRHRLRKAILLEGNVWQSERVRSPFVFGAVRPRIYVPYGLDNETLRCVLEHERYHLKWRDHLAKLFAFLLLSVHWFNPLCWLAFYLMGRDMEMRCDEAVLAAGGSKQHYGKALVAFASNRRIPSPGPLAFGESNAKKRVKHILKWKKPRMWASVLSIAICLTCLLACAADPVMQENAVNKENVQQETAAQTAVEENVVMQALATSDAVPGNGSSSGAKGNGICNQENCPADGECYHGCANGECSVETCPNYDQCPHGSSNGVCNLESCPNYGQCPHGCGSGVCSIETCPNYGQCTQGSGAGNGVCDGTGKENHGGHGTGNGGGHGNGRHSG